MEQLKEEYQIEIQPQAGWMCKRCGAINKDGDEWCWECGAKKIEKKISFRQHACYK